MTGCTDYHVSSEEDIEDYTEVGFMFDAYIEKATRDFTFGENKQIIVKLNYVEQEPGALQSGHFLWPAAPALCEYLVKHWKELPHGNVVELGAGCGLAGLVAAQLNPQSTVIFTDHDPGVLKTVDHTITLQPKLQGNCKTQTLHWGPKGAKEIAQIKNLLPPSNSNIDLIIGTDVIYAKEIVTLLFWTVDQLLVKDDKTRKFIMCSSFCYDDATESQIDEECKRYNLNRVIISCTLNKEGGSRVQEFFRK